MPNSLEWPSQSSSDSNPQTTFKENDNDLIYKELDLPLDSSHPFTSNLWYKSMKRKVQKLTQNSCYACSLLPQSTEELFPYVAAPLTGNNGLPSSCVLAYQYVIQTHPIVGSQSKSASTVRSIIRPNNIHIGRTNNAVYKVKGLFHKMTQYVIYSNLTVHLDNGKDISNIHATVFNVREHYPSLLGCPTLYRKHIFQSSTDLSTSPSRVSASVNTSAVFDLCVSGQAKKSQSTSNMGFLHPTQCFSMVEHPGDHTLISEIGVATTPGFYWCCGKNVWTSLPPLFKGICGVCTLNDIVYIVQPVEFLNTHSQSSRDKKRVVKGSRIYTS